MNSNIRFIQGNTVKPHLISNKKFNKLMPLFLKWNNKELTPLKNLY